MLFITVVVIVKKCMIWNDISYYAPNNKTNEIMTLWANDLSRYRFIRCEQ